MKIFNLKTLSLALFCFVSVQSVWADEVTVSTAQELTDALAAASKTASNPTVITLGADFSGTSTKFLTPDFTIASGKYVTLNLNGKTLTGGGYGSVFMNYGTLVIEDIKAEGDPAKDIYSDTNTDGYKSGKITGGYAKEWASETDKKLSGAYGGAVWNLGSLTIASGTFTGNYARNGGAFGNYNESGVSYTITGGLICNNTSCNQGGAIATWTTNSKITVSNAAFISNTTTANGGAIFNVYGTTTVNSGTFTSNSAGYGGAVYGGSSTTVTIKGGTFTGNTATTCGGVVYSVANFTIEAGTFTSNSARYGGAVCGYDNSTVTITGGTFTNNTATGNGGAIYSDENITIEGGTFTSNSAQNGGAVFGASSTTTTITGGTFENNSATYGGAVFSNGNITVEAGTFTSNSAQYGGAVLGYNNTTTTIIGGTFTGNYTSTSGYGAIHSNGGNLNISGNPIIKDNKVSSTDNTARNITQTVTLSGNITSGADIHFSKLGEAIKLGSYSVDDGATITCDITPSTKETKGTSIYFNNDVVLSDNSNFSHAKEQVTSVSYTRNVKNTFGTIVLPFVPATNSNVKYFMIDDGAPSEQTGVIKLTSVDTPVANTPYIFKYNGDIDNTNGTDVTFSAANTTLAAATPVANTSGKWTLTGTYSDVTKNGSASGSTFYYVASKNGTFYRAEGNTHFAPYRSWATYSGSNNAKSFTIMLDDEITGIATIENGEMQLNMGTIYDLQGRKVNTPQRGNIYIINGKKISY